MGGVSPEIFLTCHISEEENDTKPKGYHLISFRFLVEGVCRPPGKREPLLDSGQQTGQWTSAIRRKCRIFVEFFHAR